MKKFEFLSQEDYDPAEESEPLKKVSAEESEPISRQDAVSPQEKSAFTEMQRQAELEKDEIFKDPLAIEEIKTLIETLPNEREKEVVRRKFFEGETYDKIGESFGIGGARTQQIYFKALKRLKQPSTKMQDLRFFRSGNDMQPRTLKEFIGRSINLHRFKKNSEIRKVLHEIWGNAMVSGSHISQLDHQTFDEIYDELKSIVGKKEFTPKDLADLKGVAERLEQKKEKVKGENKK